ncbi:hypothetical protein LKM00_09940 [Bacillus wiedmannii]|uniref:hypothetical protein n=1 Tax=Bacillus wiedmannii TaxID=1890302 RepID=UPI0001A02B0C|nr:hypothetical protein [Bacillus wiedmannii]EEK64409.1 hypothetical protein bcere0006_54690 [Bacillus wiedmannii]MCC2377772.1 hypothetical protein [Bacillus wiedmannii]MCC2422005.1 hypothetical protein [Bacillus wiedmannii]
MTQPVNPAIPTDAALPLDPVRLVIINTWGINFVGVIQQGNTMLNGQFYPTDPFSPVEPI